MKLLFIGHSTVKLDVAETAILIDPYFADKAGPFVRTAPLTITIKDVLPIDIVLISHTHPDHFDKAALSNIRHDTPVLVPDDQKEKVQKIGLRNVIGMIPWQRYNVDKTEIHAVPASHMKNVIGFVIKGDSKTLYFAGDTIFFDGFREIALKFEKIDVALLPVDGGKLFFKKTTMTPEDAIKALKILKPRHVIPIHCGNTPRLPIVKKSGDPYTFQELGKKAAIGSDITILKEGDTLEI